MQSEHQQLKPKVFYRSEQQEWKPASYETCLFSVLGNKVDVQWDIKDGVMRLSKSTDNITLYHKKEEGIQIIKGAQFCHGAICPLMNNNIQKTAGKFMKSCACVMLYNNQKSQFLLTQRSPTLRTYPNAWVLPGGHLDPGEGIFQGGIRECQEQVGLPKEKNSSHPIKQNTIMLWQSVFTVDGHVKAAAIVVFFMALCQQFEVKINPHEVSEYKWKNLNDKSDQKRYCTGEKSGYAEGHLKYLEIVRNNFDKKPQF